VRHRLAALVALLAVLAGSVPGTAEAARVPAADPAQGDVVSAFVA
jgi:hypothetical protein